MTLGLGRRSGAAAVVLTALLLAVPASPAHAAVTITIDQPKSDAVLETSSLTASGKASTDSLLNIVRRVTVTLTGKAPVTVDCADSPCPFSTPLSMAANGKYELTVTATEADRVLGLEGATGKEVRSFRVEAPPAKPVLDTPKVTDARTVALSWSRNTEPDMLYYVVFRKDPGGGGYGQISNEITQPSSGAKVTFTDVSTGAGNGGDFSYQVAAVRKGRSGTADTLAKSASGPATATVPVPATTTTAPAPPGSPAAAGPTTTAKPGPPAGVDLSGFLSSRSQPAVLPPITVPEPPDTGFQGTLPFGARLPGDDVEEGPAEAVPPSGRRTTSVIVDGARSRPLVPIAGGLVLFLVALHLRMLNRKVQAPADPDLPVDRVAPAPSPAPAPAVEEPVPVAAAPPPFDVMEQDDDWDAEWAAAMAELDAAPEPEPQPVTEPEPPEPEPPPHVLTLWAPPEEPAEEAPDDDDPGVDFNQIEVFEVVSPVPRRLARAGRP